VSKQNPGVHKAYYESGTASGKKTSTLVVEGHYKLDLLSLDLSFMRHEVKLEALIKFYSTDPPILQ